MGPILLLVAGLTVFGFLSSYVRMSSKVSNYNSLRHDIDILRTRYRDLQKVTNQKNEQLATLEVFASEVSVAYGLNRKPVETLKVSANAGLRPTFRESLSEYNLLQSASLSPMFRKFPKRWHVNVRPSLWPVDGRLLSPFGGRSDPFSGEGAMHTGVDMTASTGTAVHATADGIVAFAEWSGRYGQLVVVDHGNGMQTYYAHLSRFEVVSGQEIRRGDVVGKSGSTGRSTAPHLHYEVRIGGTPVNPYPYLAQSVVSLSAKPVRDLPF
ncbi:MAG: M23 family metallopeptidase [Acidobacteriota bacterium]|nr:M23 family metallopeptidase [Acidobacteriota bacterium]